MATAITDKADKAAKTSAPKQGAAPKAETQGHLAVDMGTGPLPGFDAGQPHRDQSTESGWRQVGTMSNSDFMALVGALDGDLFTAGKLNVEDFQRAPIGFGVRSYKFDMAIDMMAGREVPVIIVYRFDGKLYLEDGQQRADTLRMALRIAKKASANVKLDATEAAIYDEAVKRVAVDGRRLLSFEELSNGRQGLDLRWGLTPFERLAYFDTYNRKGAKVSTRHIVEATASAGGWADRFKGWGFDLSTELFEKTNSGRKAKPAEGEVAPAKGTKMAVLLACAYAYTTGDQSATVADMDEASARQEAADVIAKFGDTETSQDFQWLFNGVVPTCQAAYSVEWVKENFEKVTAAPTSVKQIRTPADLFVVSVMAALGKARLSGVAEDKIASAKTALLAEISAPDAADPLDLGALEELYSSVRGAQGEAHRRFFYTAFMNLFMTGATFIPGTPLNWALGDTSKKSKKFSK